MSFLKKIWEEIKLIGIVPLFSLLISLFTIGAEVFFALPDLKGGVRCVIKSQVYSNQLQNNPGTIYVLYLQFTNTSITPIDINSVEVQVEQNNEWKRLIIAEDVPKLIEENSKLINDTSFIYLTHDTAEFYKKLFFYKKTIVEPGKSIDGFLVCLGQNPDWFSKYTTQYKIRIVDKMNNPYKLPTKNYDNDENLGQQIVEELTNVKFHIAVNKTEPD